MWNEIDHKAHFYHVSYDKWHFHNNFVFVLFNSPEHKVLILSYCDHLMSFIHQQFTLNSFSSEATRPVFFKLTGMFLLHVFYCVTCIAWQKHRDRVVASSWLLLSHFSFPFSNFCRDTHVSFRICRFISLRKYWSSWILVKICQIVAE